MSTETQHLLRLTRVLEERAIPIEPVLTVVTAVGTANVYLAVGTLTERLHLLVPSQPDAVAAVALSAVMPERSMLLVSAHRAQLTAAAVIGGAVTLREAVDAAGPPSGRDAWLSSLESLAGGTVRNRARFLTEERGSVTLSFPPRSGDAESTFARDLGAAATRLGAPDSWRSLYAEAGAGADVNITTECTSTGPAPRLALRFGGTVWDRAIDLAKAMFDTDRARGAAVRMGMLAGTLEIDTLRGVEAVLDRDEPDLVVWLKLRQDG